MKTAKYVLAVALGLVVLVAPRTASADDIVMINVSNLMWNSVTPCGQTPCGTETLNGSMEWNNTMQAAVPNTSTMTQSGFVSGDLALDPNVGIGTFVGSSGTFPFFGVEWGPNFGDLLILNMGLSTNSVAVGNYLIVPLSSLAPGLVTAELFLDSNGVLFSGDPISGTISVSPVPEPSSLLLLGTGLLGLAGAIRRKWLA